MSKRGIYKVLGEERKAIICARGEDQQGFSEKVKLYRCGLGWWLIRKEYQEEVKGDKGV